MKRIPLTQGQFALVDDGDFRRFGNFKWYAAWDRKRQEFRAVRGIKKNGKVKTVRLHRAIMGAKNWSMKVDHINHNPLDNRRDNLRVCTHTENCRNRRGPQKNSTSGVRGVYWNKLYGKWQARIRIGGKNKHLGVFVEKSKAASAYASANRTRYGKFGGGL